MSPLKIRPALGKISRPGLKRRPPHQNSLKCGSAPQFRTARPACRGLPGVGGCRWARSGASQLPVCAHPPGPSPTSRMPLSQPGPPLYFLCSPPHYSWINAAHVDAQAAARCHCMDLPGTLMLSVLFNHGCKAIVNASFHSALP